MVVGTVMKILPVSRSLFGQLRVQRLTAGPRRGMEKMTGRFLVMSLGRRRLKWSEAGKILLG